MTLDLKGWIGTCQLGCEGNFKLRNENRIREATGIWNICITEWVSLNHFICIFEFELSGNNLKLSIVCWNWLTSTFRRDIYKEYRHIGLGGKKELTLNAITTEGVVLQLYSWRRSTQHVWSWYILQSFPYLREEDQIFISLHQQF